jgi:tricorn protease
VQPIDNEQSLRYTAWVNDNRRKVEQATGGRIAYVHLPNTATAGVQEFAKQFFPQVDKQGLIVDERFNGGGFVPDFLVERMARRTWVYWSNRDGTDFRTPSESIDGPKCMVANEYAGSGGDCLPYYFRLAGIGPVIGKRTWGGLVGISQNIPLMDGGVVTMPDFGMWDPQAGGWVVENHGVDPDIEVENVPADMVSGRDAQLERAIQWCLSELEKRPAERPARPAYKVRVDRR